jgi:hypothetical protein
MGTKFASVLATLDVASECDLAVRKRNGKGRQTAANVFALNRTQYEELHWEDAIHRSADQRHRRGMLVREQMHARIQVRGRSAVVDGVRP